MIATRLDQSQYQRFPEFNGHESVTRIEDSDTGLVGFISIHNTRIGPSVGGTRYWKYRDEEDALRDSLRLSHAMTYKCALAGVPYGGGKAAIIAPVEHTRPPEATLTSYANWLAALEPPFFTGEDVGLCDDDVRILAAHAPDRIVGKPDVAGMPAEWAALSVYDSMRAAAEERLGNSSLSGCRIAIKGLGNVGTELCRLLMNDGAIITAADIRPERAASAAARFPNLTLCPAEAISEVICDIYAPCALGNDIQEERVERLACRIVCGSANNQLGSARVGRVLHERHILYVPDYVANAGGLINVVDELNPAGYSRERVRQDVDRVRETVRELIRISLSTDTPMSDVADNLARQRLNAAV